MNKVLLMNVLFKPNIGGIENSLAEIAVVLKNSDYIVDIVSSDRNNISNEKLDLFENDDAYNIYRYEYSFKRFSIFQNIINSAKLLIKLNNRSHYSYVISRSYFLVIIGTLVGIRNIKYIAPEVTFFSTKGQKNNVSIKSQLSKYSKTILQTLSFLLAKEVFVFSETMVYQIKKSTFNIVDPIKVEPGINLERFSIPDPEEKQTIRSQLNIPNDKNVILCLGRFSEIKQFDIAINSITELPEDYLLLLVGSGPEKEHYNNLILDKKIHSRVKILDSTTQPEKFYKLSDVFLMTSRYESFGQTILEAYASGLRIIAFNKKAGVNTNIESILANCSGVFYVEEQSPKQLAIGIQHAIKSDVIKEDITLSTGKLKARYSWSQLVNSLGIPT